MKNYGIYLTGMYNLVLILTQFYFRDSVTELIIGHGKYLLHYFCFELKRYQLIPVKKALSPKLQI